MLGSHIILIFFYKGSERKRNREYLLHIEIDISKSFLIFNKNNCQYFNLKIKINVFQDDNDTTHTYTHRKYIAHGQYHDYIKKY